MERLRKIIRTSLIVVVVLIAAFVLSWIIYMPNSAERGVWQHEADGQLLTLSRTQANLYHQTSHSCTAGLSFPAHMALVKAMEGAWVEVEGDTLDLVVDGNLAPLRFNRIDALPAACGETADPSPANTFEALWTVMDEHYAFFDLHGVDWDARRRFAPAPGEQLSQVELYERLQATLEGLDDGHVQLIAGELGFFSPAQPAAWMPEEALSRQALNATARQTIDTPLAQIENTWLEYGLRPDGIGYILISNMWTDPGIGQLGTELAVEAMAEVSAALSDARVIIIDVRYNPGGDDGTAFAYASYFADEPVLALSKRTRLGDGWTQAVEASVEPAPANARLTVPTVLLTSRLTGSGAEIFTMAMREMPRVTVMGENTGGGLSDILGITLPNGWQFGLSNQEYLTPDGVLHEAAGLPPDIAIETDGAALARGEDPVLVAAIQWATEQF